MRVYTSFEAPEVPNELRLLVASTQQEHLNASSEERSEVNARIYSTFKDILRASNESLCGYASALTFEGRQCLEKDLLELAPPAQTIITRFFEQVGKRVAEEEFAQRLSLWAEEASDAEEDRATAAKRILAAYNTKASTLCLRRLKLSSLPLELVELTDLNTLDLSHNHIRTFPLFLNQLPQLGGLLLSNNRIEILPDEISSLSALDLLNLAHNEISYIPDSIGMLRQLESLDLAFNRLSTLPATMGEMQQLRSLFLRDNGGLSELPFTCDHLARMTDIDAQGTGVTTPSQVALNLAMALGDLYWDAAEDTDLTLPQLGFLLAFDEREAFLIKDWLQRLSATVDYEQCPAPLALRTCQMLASLESSAPFREAFFAQVMSNNRRCSDRSSMAFNELYTAWRIACLPVEASVEEKLDILAAIARTVTLRNAITNIFDAIGENPEESVETFLLFESKLRDVLELDSPIQKSRFTSHHPLHESSQEAIDAMLIAAVEVRYMDTLADLDIVKEMAQSAHIYSEEEEKARYEDLERLGELVSEGELSESLYKEQVDALMQSRESSQHAIRLAWLQEKLDQ